MFVQVIRGQVNDPEQAHAAFDPEMEEMSKLSVGEPEFLDLRQPWLYSPR